MAPRASSAATSCSVTASTQQAAQRQDRDETEELTADDHAHDVDRRLPRDLAVLHDVDADRPDLDAEPHPCTGATSRLPVLDPGALAATAAPATAHDRNRDDGRTVGLVGLAVHAAHGHHVLHAADARERGIQALRLHGPSSPGLRDLVVRGYPESSPGDQ